MMTFVFTMDDIKKNLDTVNSLMIAGINVCVLATKPRSWGLIVKANC